MAGACPVPHLVTFSVALAQLRHLYAQMVGGHVKDCAGAARGLLGPSIETLEQMNPAITVKPLIWTEWRSSVADPKSLSAWHANVGQGRCYHVSPPWRNDNGPWMLSTESMWMEDPEYVSTFHPTLEAAQAAAQVEWSAFVREAIES